MPQYSTPRDAVYDRLSADSGLLAILTGGIWKQPLSFGVRDGLGKANPPGSTPEAYDAASKWPRPAASVPERESVHDPLGISTAFMTFPQIWIYAPKVSSGFAAVQSAWQAVFGLLHLWTYTTTNGTGVEIRVVSQPAPGDDPQDDRRIFAMMRLQADGLWRRE